LCDLYDCEPRLLSFAVLLVRTIPIYQSVAIISD
jgi:hypothetical protein